VGRGVECGVGAGSTSWVATRCAAAPAGHAPGAPRGTARTTPCPPGLPRGPPAGPVRPPHLALLVQRELDRHVADAGHAGREARVQPLQPLLARDAPQRVERAAVGDLRGGGRGGGVVRGSSAGGPRLASLRTAARGTGALPRPVPQAPRPRRRPRRRARTWCARPWLRLRCCVCSRVLTTHSGLVTTSVATPAPAAAVMWTAGVAGTCWPAGSGRGGAERGQRARRRSGGCAARPAAALPAPPACFLH
jgi:hypothetical protein